ncbi:MAG: hypothetical protein P8163_06860 [Candidatus Thiodiazotropha sp.]
MKRNLALLFFLVAPIGTVNAGGISTTPDILNSIDDSSQEFMLNDERSATRGEVFYASWNQSAATKAQQWCRNRGICFWQGNFAMTMAIDPKLDGSIIIKSY